MRKTLENPYLYFLKHNIQTRLGNGRPALLAGFKITHRCNLQCRACPFWRRPAPDIPFDKAIDVMRRLREDGVRLLIFEGGEPFLWKDGWRRIEDLVAEARRRFFAVGITTNGTLPLDTAADILWVSIDGLKTTHNQNRGPVFDKVIENIRRSRHPKLVANVTINRLNVSEIPVLVKYLAGVAQIKGITIQFFYPYEDSEDLSISWDERQAVLEQLIELKHAGYPVLDSRAVLERMKDNRWRCHDWLIADAEPDGSITMGCYLKNRGTIDCSLCGFAAHAELSLAYDWNVGAIETGRRVFGFRTSRQ